jgi:hypothetical protein
MEKIKEMAKGFGVKCMDKIERWKSFWDICFWVCSFLAICYGIYLGFAQESLWQLLLASLLVVLRVKTSDFISNSFTYEILVFVAGSG